MLKINHNLRTPRSFRCYYKGLSLSAHASLMLEPKGQGGCYARTTPPLNLGPRLSEGLQEAWSGVMGSGSPLDCVDVQFAKDAIYRRGCPRRVYT
eukprot:scaffold84458_cov18-Prasinocladus_malaysianus.AAC.1